MSDLVTMPRTQAQKLVNDAHSWKQLFVSQKLEFEKLWEALMILEKDRPGQHRVALDIVTNKWSEARAAAAFGACESDEERLFVLSQCKCGWDVGAESAGEATVRLTRPTPPANNAEFDAKLDEAFGAPARSPTGHRTRAVAKTPKG